MKITLFTLVHDREIAIEKIVWQTYFTKVQNRKKEQNSLYRL